MTKTHELKIWPDHFEDIENGKKPFDVRYNDRNYLPGELLYLREWNPNGTGYTGRECTKKITHVMRSDHRIGVGLRDEFVVLGLSPWRVQKCAATIATDPPQDCDWPWCGCDENANSVIAAIDESGGVLVHRFDLQPVLQHVRAAGIALPDVIADSLARVEKAVE